MLSALFDRPGGRGSESDDDALDTGPSVANPPATVAGYDDSVESIMYENPGPSGSALVNLRFTPIRSTTYTHGANDTA